MASNGTNPADIIASKSTQDLLRETQELENTGRYKQSLAHGREVVKRKPAMANGHYVVGSALCGLGLLYDAETALKKAIARNPNVAGFYTRYSEVLNRLGHYEKAVEMVDKAVTLSPGDPKVLVVKALVLWLGGNPEDAYSLLDEAIKNGSDDPNLRSVHGAIAGQIGKVEQGINELEGLVKEGDRGDWTDRFMFSAILMHLSKLYDKAGRYDDAFHTAQRGGDMRLTGYNPQKNEETCGDRIRVWSQETIDQLPRSRVDSEKPVFIVGMPRSGTSLVEQIIASHPLAYGAGELTETYRMAKELCEPTTLQPDRMDVVRQLKRPTLDRSARKILKEMERAAGKDALRITDKLPNNYEHVGMIGLIFPKAKIIHCKRNALDNCVSCFLLDFVGDTNHGYSYNLEHMAHHYKLYQRYMEHWAAVSLIEILEVDYEELVANPVDGAKRIIEYVGLEWDDQCAKSHETKRAVSTLSSDQVRKPMYTSSVSRWKNYEKHIGVLIEELGTD
jgi:tetratricopeptide (TPR) repeat protein